MHSIRLRFIVFVAVLVVLLMLVMNTIPLITSRNAVFEEKRHSMGSQATVLASSLAGLERLSSAGIAEVLTILDLPEYDRISVADAAGELLYDSGDTPLQPLDIETALQGRTVFRSRFQKAAFRSSLAMPVSGQGGLTGVIYLQELDTEHAVAILTVQRRLRTASVLVGLTTAVLAFASIYLVTRRLRSLTASMRVVAEGNYHYRHPIRGRDEITELGEEFNQLTERLESTETARRRFVADASHELKTPLASIRLLSDSIVQNSGMDAGTIREFVSDIGEETVRLQRTTEKLLTLSRLDDEVRFAPEPIDLSQAALDVLTMLRPLAQEKQVALRTDLEEGSVIMGSRDDVDHILYNLIENAIKYNRTGGSVLVRIESDPQQLRLHVEDTGIGIPEADRPHIFDRFYRVDKARSREAGGSGLGLSIVHDAVLAHGGSITVGQNKPQGSCFVVSFPRPTVEETGL